MASGPVGGPKGASFEDEPVAAGSKKNPELRVELPHFRAAIEVKPLA